MAPRREHGADDAFPVSDIDRGSRQPALSCCSRVFTRWARTRNSTRRVIGWVNRRAPGGQARHAHAPRVRRTRPPAARDAPTEEPCRLVSMRRSANIAAPHRQALGARQPGSMEYEVMAEIRTSSTAAGRHLPTTIRSSAAPERLRATAEKQPADAGRGNLLIDAGREFDYYASDVTPHAARRRSLQPPPARDPRGRARGAESRDPRSVRAGAHWNEPHEAAVRAIAAGPVVRISL